MATTGGLKVYDITDPANPLPKVGGQLIGGTLLPSLDFSTVRGVPGQPYVYANSYTDNTTYVIDVATSTVVGKVSYGGSNTIRRSWVEFDEAGRIYLYTANSTGDLWIVDVTTPVAPVIVSYWNSPAGGIANMPGGSVHVSNGYAVVITSTGNNVGYAYLLDVRDPSRPLLLDTLYDAAFGFNDVRVDGRQVHIAAHDGWKLYRLEGWQPDAWIRALDTVTWTGDAVYETTAVEQVATGAVVPGETATFQVRIENDADQPDRIGLSGSSKAGWTTQYLLEGLDVTASILDGTFLTAMMDPGETFTLTLRVTPDGTVPLGDTSDTVLTVSSWVTASTCACPGAIDEVEALVTVQRPQVLVVKDDSLTSVEPGQSIEYTVTFANIGAVDARATRLTDVLPDGLDYVEARPAPQQVLADTPGAGQTTLVWDVGTLAPEGAPCTVTVSALLTGDSVTFGSLRNTARVDYVDAAANAYDATATDSDAVDRPLLVKDVDLHQALWGDTLTYSLWPFAPSADLLENVRVVDPIPVDTTYLAGSANAGGVYGAYVPLPAEPGTDAGPPILDTAMTTSTSFVAPGSTVTVTLNVRASAVVNNVSPIDFTVTGGAFAILSGPTPASANVPNGGAGVNFVWTVRLDEAAEYRFSAGAEDAAATTSWPPATSASVLASSGGPNVVTWDLGSNVPGVPGEFIDSGRFPGLFAFRGGGTTEFSRYASNTASWAAMAPSANVVAKGGSLTTDGAGTIWASMGNSQSFSRYDIVTNTWAPLANASNNFTDGGAIQYLNVGGTSYVYAMLGGSTRFRRYNVATNTWTNLANTPNTVRRGGALTTDGTNLYAFEGNKRTGFWRYNVATNTWTVLAPAPATVSAGGSLTCAGGFIYAFRGGSTRTFWRYSIATNTWTVMALAPATVTSGGALTTDGTTVWALQGGTRAAWAYDILTNTWRALQPAGFTGNVGQGGALVYDQGVAPVGRFITLSVSRSLLSSGDVLTVRATVSSSYPETDVTVPASPTVTSVNGATVTLAGPVLISADDDIAGIGDPVIYEWTGVVTSGALPGSLRVSAAATAGLDTWPSATSPSVLVSPVLQYRATVDADAVSPVTNTAGLYGVPVTQVVDAQSNEVVTELGGSIGDFVWYDADGDAAFDFGEAGLDGVIVRATPPAGVDLGAGPGQPVTAATDADGYYLFPALPVGSYTISIVAGSLPPGMAPTFDHDGTPDGTYVRALSAGEHCRGADFGFDDAGAIGDLVFADDDGDGAPDAGEAGIPGITVRLYDDANGNGLVDAGESLLATSVSDASGAYLIGGLPAGDYVAVVDDADPALPAGYEPTTAGTVSATLTPGQVFRGADFGFTDFGSIGDRLWQDLDGDGAQDAGEPGLNGVLILLVGPYGGEYAVTGADGVYLFEDLPSGDYSVTVIMNAVPAGYSLGTDPDGTLDGRYDVALAVGGTFTTADFGFAGLGSIGDAVWYDADGDAVQDAGEMGIAGVTVSLYTDVDHDGRIEPGEPLYGTAVTDASGRYSFGLLAPGYFVVDVPITDPALAGITATTPTNEAVSLAPAQAYAQADFGFGPFAQLGDFVWHDVDEDGVQDPGEPGIEGMTVTLSDASGVVATTTTDADGFYVFRGSTAGQYTAAVTVPAGLRSPSIPTARSTAATPRRSPSATTTGRPTLASAAPRASATSSGSTPTGTASSETPARPVSRE